MINKPNVLFISFQELNKYLALTVLMSFSTRSISDYWSTDVLLHSPVYSAAMSRNRYQLISKFLHFADNTKDENQDKLYKIRPVLSYLVGKFKEVYTPSKVLAIDEQRLLNKESSKRFTPGKQSKLGLKFVSLCDEKGYLYNTECHAGRNSELNTGGSTHGPVGKSGQVVIRLFKELMGRGHHLYVDKR